jgi:hypothetical protein
MKKVLYAAAVISIVVVAAIYFAIPSTLKVVAVVPARCNVDGADRALRDTANREKWWPEEGSGTMHFKVTKLFRRMVDVSIVDGAVSVSSQLSVYPKVRIDSCTLQWVLNLPSGPNPITRVERYLEAKKLAAGMQETLSKLGYRLEDQRLIYGMDITEGNTEDSVLVSTVRVLDRYPSDPAIYVLVDHLRQFVLRHGGAVTGYPMLNVTNELGRAFKVEVGLPTNKMMNDADDIRWRRLIRVVFLVADVHGGDSTIREAVRQMANYVSDYQRTVMAIPYQSLVTDRMKEQDTTRWITRLYVPVYPIH